MAESATIRMPQATIPPIEHTFGKLALGCWVFGRTHWGGQNVQDSRAVMEAALRRGMNHFDTSSAFGDGVSETLVGEFLKQDYHRRDGMCIATKLLPREGTAEEIEKSLASSRSRLSAEVIDLYYVQWPLPRVDMRPMFEVLAKEVEEGRVRAVGVSNFSLEQLKQAREVCPIHAVQFCYNLLWRPTEVEKELIPYCNESNLATITTSSIAQGLLTGRFGAEPMFAAGDNRVNTVWHERGVWPKVFATVEKMKEIAKEAGRPLSHLAIRWLSRKAEISSIVVGARTSVQLNELAGAMVGEIDEAHFDKLTAISDEFLPSLPEAGNIFRYYP
ncbi:MAG: aldo/keto reductase [Phycisphaeraceae bacterium]